MSGLEFMENPVEIDMKALASMLLGGGNKGKVLDEDDDDDAFFSKQLDLALQRRQGHPNFRLIQPMQN